MCSNDDEPKVSLLLIYRRRLNVVKEEEAVTIVDEPLGEAVNNSDGMSVDDVNYYDTLII